MEAYLDNSATTRCSESVRDIMLQVMMEDYGNPSSLHLMGKKAEDYIKEAREKIAKTLKVTEKEIVFTSGGTESNNLAIIGSAMANQRAGKHIITTAIEHASVASVVGFLEEQGFEVTILPVDENGQISLEELEAAIREDTILVSMMQINNEMGAIEPIAEAGALIKKKNPNTLFHVDAIQSYGKLRIYPKKMSVDMLSVSGHKLHGPKGSGFLYIKDKTKVKPILFGGGQQKGMRSGTENVPAIAGLGVACEEIYRNYDANYAHLREVKEAFLKGIATIEGTHINGCVGEDSAPHIVSVSFEEIDKSEALLHALEDRGIYVSAGSACSSNKPAVSATLKAIGVPKAMLTATLRFSFSVHTTIEEVEYALDALRELLPFLRKYRSH